MGKKVHVCVCYCVREVTSTFDYVQKITPPIACATTPYKVIVLLCLNWYLHQMILKPVDLLETTAE